MTQATMEITRYMATSRRVSRIDIETPGLPVALNQMIVWIMTHPERAEALLPDYYRVRDQEDGHAEGSAKNWGIEV